jgi:predicted metal-dependent HD superfamily phosphohydrolase
MNLEATFKSLVEKYDTNTVVIDRLWTEINKSYSNKKRHYHNLTHLENLWTALNQHKNLIQDWDAILFALFYHDIVYHVLKKDNEEKSALLAEKRLKEINIPTEKVTLIKNHILATQSHELNHNNDTNLFTDADLSILGSKEEVYKSYCQKIRKEYAIYPDFMYYSGRKKVLTHFLGMAYIYKTKHFRDLYEENARKNMTHELQLCQS